MLNKEYKNQPGFSMLEIVLMIGILALAFSGIMFVVVQNSQSEYGSKNSLVALNLAQEGLELAKQTRNVSWGSSLPPYTSLTIASPVDGSTYAFRIDYQGPSSILAVSGPTSSAANLTLEATGLYKHGGATATKFNRSIYTISHTAGYMDVRSEVYWLEEGKSNYVTLETKFYDYK